MLDVPRKLVRRLAQLLAAERRALGTRRGTRALTCFYQALRRAADEGWAFVILDGKLFDCDRVTETVLSVKGEAR